MPGEIPTIPKKLLSQDTLLILARLDSLEKTVNNIVNLLRGEGENIGMVAQAKLNTNRIGELESNENAVAKHIADTNPDQRMLLKHDRMLLGEDGDIKSGIVSRFEIVEKTFSTQGKIIMVFVLAIVSALGGATGTFIVSAIMRNIK